MSSIDSGYTIGRFTIQAENAPDTGAQHAATEAPTSTDIGIAPVLTPLTLDVVAAADARFYAPAPPIEFPSPPAGPIAPTRPAAIDPRSPAALHRLYKAHQRKKKAQALAQRTVQVLPAASLTLGSASAGIPVTASLPVPCPAGVARPVARAGTADDIRKILASATPAPQTSTPADDPAGGRKVEVLRLSPGRPSAFRRRG